MRLRRRTVALERVPADTVPLNEWLESGLGNYVWQRAFDRRAHNNRKMIWTEVPVSA